MSNGILLVDEDAARDVARILKRRGVEAIGARENLHLAAADLAVVPLSAAMRRSPGWDPEVRTIMVAEGLLMYLDDAQIRGLFEELGACTGPDSLVAFSHLLSLDAASPAEHLGLRLMGEPWLSAVSRVALPAYVASFGWRVVHQDDGPEQALEGFATAERA